MNKTTVFIVTNLGKALLDKPQGRITGDARLLVGLIDGKASVAEIAEKIPPSVRVKLVEIFTRLQTYGVIEEKGGAGTGAVLRKDPASKDAEIENKQRIELEKELLEVRSKLETTIARQKKVEEDYFKLTQQVSAYVQGGQAKPDEKASERHAKVNAGNDTRALLDSINQLNEALLEKQEILANTLKLRSYQAQLSPERHLKEREADDSKMALTHPNYKSLRGLEFFRGFSNADMLNFVKIAKWQEVEAGDTILSEGDFGMSFYIVVSGTINIFRKGNLLTTLDRGDFFGEFAYLSGEEPVRSAHAVAATDGELLAIDPLDIEFSPVQLRLRVVEALLRGQVRRALLSDQRVDKFSGHLENPS
ncbi:MAG: cyclic nucleotide-binding domain-containing protein [Nitrosomonadales bacterium]|nr:cyclic nucleotide-binding domain-containing protein [Nitrosomonadales bacterium]